MAQNQQTGLLGQYLTVNTAANTTALSSALVVGNSSVNVVVNSSSVYVNGAPLGGAVNVAAQFAWTNTHSFSGVVTHNANVVLGTAGISANGSYGTANQVLTSNGSTTYWASASGGFTNGQSISVNNFVVTGTVTANGSAGAAGQTLVSNGAGVNWSSLVPSYNYSAQFNGSSYLNAPSNAVFALGTGDFTAEAWVYTSAISSTVQQFVIDVGGAGGFGFGIYSNKIHIAQTGVADLTDFATTLTNNTWYHIALVRSSGSTKAYVNGIQQGTAYTDSTSYTASGITTIGSHYDGTIKLTGYISNARIVKGVAVYTGNFTVPTSPLQTTQAAGTNIAAITGTQTSLLTCSALTLTDSSSFNNVITNNGGVVASATSNPPFTYSSVSIPTTSLTSLRQSFTGDGSTTVFNIAGGYTPGTLSVYYNGLLLRNGSDVTATNGATITMAIAPQSGALIDVIGTVPTTYSSITPQSYSVGFVAASSQYLSIPSFTPVQTGSTPFCIEAWVYNTTFACGVFATNVYGGSGNIPYCLGFTDTGNDQAIPGPYLRFGVWTGSVWSTLASPFPCSTGVWYHVAATGDGTTTRLFINGAIVASSAGVISYQSSATTAGFYLGRRWDLSGNNYFNGYISNFRFVQGAAVYTTPFTPSGPLAAVQASSTGIGAITGAQTKLLTCNGTTIVDSSTSPYSITNSGAATVNSSTIPLFTNVSITSPSTPSMTYGVSSATAITINTATPTAICSVTITTKGKPVLIVATGDGNPLQVSGWHILQIYRDGSAIGKSIINENAGGASCNGPFALTHIDVPAAGSHTYEVRAWQGSGSFLYGESGDSQAPNIAVVELL